jgi:phosphate acyltransferase
MNTLCIAIDAMGGDVGYQSVLPAVVMAAKYYPAIEFHLYGESFVEDEVTALVRSNSSLANITFISSAASVAMNESPSSALRHKRDSSMGMALQSVASGKSHGCISAGNTGALVALGMHILKCYQGLSRPALCKLVPVIKSSASGGSSGAKWTDGSTHSYLLDLGANVDCSALQLQQFACLGAMLFSVLEKSNTPSVRLLNIGREAFKGSALIQEAAERCEKTTSLNYQGFIEADEIFQGVADVIVCDGFSGNIALKASEGAARIVAGNLKHVFSRNVFSRLLALLSQPLLRCWQDNINPDKYNGAYLLGLKGTVVKSHGGANKQQFFYALKMLIQQLQQQSSAVNTTCSSANGKCMDVVNMENVFSSTFDFPS